MFLTVKIMPLALSESVSQFFQLSCCTVRLIVAFLTNDVIWIATHSFDISLAFTTHTPPKSIPCIQLQELNLNLRWYLPSSRDTPLMTDGGGLLFMTSNHEYIVPLKVATKISPLPSLKIALRLPCHAGCSLKLLTLTTWGVRHGTQR